MATENKPFEIRINPEYESLVPPMTKEAFDSLISSIRTDGQHEPITINEKDEILDGHHRYRACKLLGIAPKHVPKTFDNPLYEKLYVIDVNLQRRQLTDVQRVELNLKKKPILQEIAKLNESLGGKGDKILSPLGRVNEVIAKDSGVSYEQVRKIETILEKAPEDLKDKVRTGKTSVNHAYTTVIRAEDHKNTPELPQGTFDIILADPPWQYEISHRGSAQDHYQAIEIEELKQLPIPASDNAILFLWATGPMQQKAFSIMEAWGFTYKAQAVWIKDKIGTGYYFRGRHELLLIGEKGDMPLPEECNRRDSVIEAPRQEHSQKPEIVYQIIERMYPNRKYLELFARSHYSEKWTVWGIEAPPLPQPQLRKEAATII